MAVGGNAGVLSVDEEDNSSISVLANDLKRTIVFDVFQMMWDLINSVWVVIDELL